MAILIEELLVIVLITTALDLLLPKGKLTEFVRVVMGMFVLVTMLAPILDFVEEDNWLDSFYIFEEDTQSAEVLAKGKLLAQQQQEQFIKEYERGMAQQIGALVSIMEGVENCAVEVESAEGELGAGRIITKIKIWVSPDDKKEQIEKVIGMYYGVEKSSIEVRKYDGYETAFE